MKKLLIIVPCLLMIAIGSFAQTSFEIIPQAGYTFGDHVNFYDAYGKVDGAINYGGSFMFNVNRRFGIELMYNHMDTKEGLYDYGTHTAFSKNNVGLNYAMIGFVPSFEIPGSTVHPFLGALLGASIVSNVPDDYYSNTKFAWGFELGTNIYVDPRIGIRLKAQLLSPADGSTSGMYIGTAGSGVNATSYYSSGVYQFGLSAGLIIGLGRVLPEQRPVRYQRSPRRYYRSSPYYY